MAAGCSPGIAKKTASIWRHRPDIARALDLWIRERMQKSLPSAASPEQQAEQVLRTAWLTARASVLWFTRISPDRTCLIPDFSHATDERMSAIESFDIAERVVGGDTVDRRIKLRLKDSGRALTLLARATGVEEKPQPANLQFTVVCERTPEKLLRELGELNPDEAATKPDEVTDPMESIPSVKKFPIN